MTSDTESQAATNPSGANQSGANDSRPALSPFARLAIEAGPLAVFFIANNWHGIMVGTAAFMIATAISVLLSIRLERRLPLMPILSCGFVLIFGGLTLTLNDELFIKIKPTVVNMLFASFLLVGLAAGRGVLKVMMGSILSLTDEGWRRLSWRWAWFFVFLAGLNEVVWRNFSTDDWVSFKVFGIMPLTLVFALLQMPLINRYLVTDAEDGVPDTPGDRPSSPPTSGG